MFTPPLQEHVLQNCLGNGGGGAGDWNASLHCPSLKFENIWDTNVMKNWNPAIFLQEPLPGKLRPPEPRPHQYKNQRSVDFIQTLRLQYVGLIDFRASLQLW